MPRGFHPRKQGDLGEAAAITWFTSIGAEVSLPLFHSPDYDLVAEYDGRLLRVQVKTSTCRSPVGHFQVQLSTSGGNQSWSGIVSEFDPARCELLFAVVGDGRQWLIPADAVEGRTGITLGGPKYSEFEVPPAGGLAVGDSDSPRIADAPGERRSWRAGADCKSVAKVLSGFESLLPHEPGPPSANKTRKQHALGRAGHAKVRLKRGLTIPLKPFEEAELDVGDRLRARADGPGRLVLERIEEDAETIVALEDTGSGVPASAERIRPDRAPDGGAMPGRGASAPREAA